MEEGSSSNAQRRADNGSNHVDEGGTGSSSSVTPRSQSPSELQHLGELCQRVEKDLNDLTLANGVPTSHGSDISSDSHDSLHADQAGKKTLGFYYLKTAIRMLTDYINDLRTSNISIDDSVQMRIEEYEALLKELEAKKQQQPDASTLLASHDRDKLISMMLDYQAVLLSEALVDQTSQVNHPPDDPNSGDTELSHTVLTTANEHVDSEASSSGTVPVYLSDTDFLEGGYMEPLTAALDLCEKQVHEFVTLLPSVIIFKLLCTSVVKTLAPANLQNFERYRHTLELLQKQDLEGVQISSNLRNSVSFCFESLVGLARWFNSVVDLLKKCGSPEWYKSALELANVRPRKRKLRWSEFSLAIRNCEWRMDLVELAFHALEKLLTEGTYTVKDATFEWSEEEGRMVLQIPRKLIQNSGTETTKLLEVSREFEENDVTALIEELEKLVVSEKAKRRFYQGLSSAHEIANYLRQKLTGPTPGIGSYLPYSFTKIDPSSLKYLEYLDKGSSGMVATHDWNEVQVAVKSVRVGVSRSKFEEEAAILGMVQHPNVVRLIGCGYIEKSDTGLLVMELMDHDLRFIIDSRLKVLPEGSSPFSPIVAIDLMLQIGQAMLYLREHNILHRDLKAKNILVNIRKPLALVESDSANTSLMRRLPAVSAVLPHTQENYVAKLADFGLAKCRPESSYVTTLNVGTTGWRAPEVFNMRDAVDYTQEYKWPADVYSFGMMCYEILTGKMPFVDEPNHGLSLHAKIMDGVRPPLDNPVRPDVNNYVPEALKELIQQCWATKAEERPTFDYIVKKLWECKVQAILPGFESQIMHASGVSRVSSSR